jgi:hypothetical protein
VTTLVIARHRMLDAVEMFAHRFEQAAAFDGQRDPARPALEQASFQPLLQLAHLMAERADGEIGLRRRARQIAQPGHQYELLQQAQRQLSHLEFPSSLACEYIAFWRPVARYVEHTSTPTLP